MERIQIGLMGLGIVGSGVAQILRQKRESIAEQVGCPVDLKRVLVRDLEKHRAADSAADFLTTDVADLLGDPEIAVIIELMGGEEPAYEYIRGALSQGKHVITANKEVMAKHGPQLIRLAEEHHAAIHYEASVGGGIPLIAPFRQSLLANDISTVMAIINGTTNYILTKMAREQIDLPQALREAQALGYAEADPTNDLEGTDAAYKLSILASLAFHTRVSPGQVYREGITRLTPRDFRYASELGYAIKLLAISKRQDGRVEARVHPTLVPADRILARVDGVYNAVEVEGDLTGRVMFYGRGAGALPTTSAVVADLIELARDVHNGVDCAPVGTANRELTVMSIDDVQTRYYVRMTVHDQPGVLAQIAQVLGDRSISIASVIQKEVLEEAKLAEIVIMTHQAQEAAMQQALRQVAGLPGAAEIGSMVRVEG